MDQATKDKLAWIFRTGWKGECPRCGKGHMFKGWLKVADTCEACGLDYRFASPDDGPAFFSLFFIAFPLLFFVIWLQVRFDPPFWVHLLTSFPLVGVGCALSLRPIKGWLVASQYINRATEAGTERLWAQMHEREDAERRDRADS